VTVKRIILALAEGAPLRRQMERMCKKVAEELGISFDVLVDDWDFLYKHAERDELGGIDLPQVFIELETGEIKHVLTRLPLDENGKVDIKTAEKILVNAIKESQ